MVNQIRGNTHILKLTRGELIAQTLIEYMQAHQIPFASLSGIGRVTNTTLATYDITKGYIWHEIVEETELTNLSGNLAWDDEDEALPRLHLHATVGDDNLRTYAGHFGDAKVYGVVEIIIHAYPGAKIIRRHLGEASFKTLDLKVAGK